MIRRRSLTSVLATLSILLFLTVFSIRDAQGFSLFSSEASARKSLPPFELNDMDGKSVSLSSFRDRVVLLNFWATWCAYCRKERAELNALHREYTDRGLVILSLAGDRSLEKVKGFLKKKPADYTVLWDRGGTVAGSYGVGGLPTNFLIDKSGTFRKKYVGYMNWSNPASQRTIEELLKE